LVIGSSPIRSTILIDKRIKTNHNLNMIYNLSFAKVPFALRNSVADELCKLLSKLGYEGFSSLVNRLQEPLNTNREFCLVLRKDETTYHSWNPIPFTTYENEVLHVVEQWDDIILALSPEKKVQLTDEYAAIVRRGYVEVGCQKIPFDKVRELYKLLPPE
jgi:hypothetical protein